MTSTVGHPPGLPDLLLDRSLGSVQVPRILRAAGLRLQTLVDVYGSPADERIEDPQWLRLAGERGWVVFMKDQRIRYREVERAAVLDSRVRAFCLSSGNLRSPEMAGHFLARLAEITTACAEPGPLLYAVGQSTLRRLDL
jgi:hypothetical protein